jgi:hypothetical protein
MVPYVTVIIVTAVAMVTIVNIVTWLRLLNRVANVTLTFQDIRPPHWRYQL